MSARHSRRGFLKLSLSTAGIAALGAPRFLVSAAEASAQASGETVLVVVQMSGGNDGLNTVIPYADDVYRRSRPLLGVPTAQVRKINDYVGLHPSMGGFSTLLEKGWLGIVQGVGYPLPDRSHFSSMDIWQTVRREVGEHGAGFSDTGWIGRYLDARAAAPGSAAAAPGQDVPALHLAAGAPRLPLALVGHDLRAGSFESVDAFRLEDNGDASLRRTIGAAVGAARPERGDLLSFLHQASASALESSRQVQDAVRKYKTDIKYPQTSLGRRLQTVAQLVDAGLKTRVYYLDHDGFDTHANQAVAHGALLGELSDAVSAFVRDMSQHGHGKRVLVMTFSEFGRRVHENASQGTDHGAAAPMFLAGGAVCPGLLGMHPSMTDLDQGDLKFTTDFRDVYAGVLENWLGVKSEPILEGRFKPVKVTTG